MGAIPAVQPERELPYAIEAEMATLGSMLISSTAAETALGLLERDDFYFEGHRRIFEAMDYLVWEGIPVDTRTTLMELRRRKFEASVGGVDYLDRLNDSTDTAKHVAAYARTVKEKSQLRKLIEQSRAIIEAAYAQDETPTVIAGRAEQGLLAIHAESRSRDFQQVREATFVTMAKAGGDWEAATGAPAGFTALETLLPCFPFGDFSILAGRPSMGKTALALFFAVTAAARAGLPVAIFSLEMSRQQLVDRMVAAEAQVCGMRLQAGKVFGDSLVRVGRAAGMIGDLPIYIDDSSDLTIGQLRSKARRFKRQHGSGLIIVDYVQKVRGNQSNGNKHQEMTEVAEGHKAMARETECHVMGLSQLSRGVERREDKRPMLSDLRESGSLEAEADIVMLLYRAMYYERQISHWEGIEPLEIHLAKHRNGGVGVARVGFDKRYGWFGDLEERYEEQPGFKPWQAE